MRKLLFTGSLFCLAACTTVAEQSGITAHNSVPAKNVILFIGDGMGVSTVTATRIYVGQSLGETGEDYVLPFERFPNVALVKTYNTNQQVPDSAGTATALMTGTKTRAGMISVGPKAHRGDCREAKTNQLSTLGELANTNGKAVGIVTTTRLTHATPATVYAHSPERNWEADSHIPADQAEYGCQDIAKQLTEFSFDVALGGGKSNFLGSGLNGKRRTADQNLPKSWEAQTGGSYVTTKSEMLSAPADTPLLGLFSDSHMSYMIDKTSTSSEPTLTEMTGVAIQRLSKSGAGYFLMVEGGRIDHGHHQGQAGYALSEAKEFATAVQHAIDTTDPNDTLILVTADHSHVFTIAGYPTRGNPILGLVYGNDEHGEPNTNPLLAADGIPYTTLGYHNGPGAIDGSRLMPSTDIKAKQQSLVPTGKSYGDLSETHGGEDVAIYANGPGAHRVKGVMEQNKIYDVITSAFGLETE